MCNLTAYEIALRSRAHALEGYDKSDRALMDQRFDDLRILPSSRSSSWSYCFLSPAGGWVIPDHTANRKMLAALQRADWDAWRNRSLEQIELTGG